MNTVANGGLVSLGRIEHGMGLESKDQNSNNIGLSCYSAFSEAEFNLRSLSTNIFVGSKNIWATNQKVAVGVSDTLW